MKHPPSNAAVRFLALLLLPLLLLGSIPTAYAASDVVDLSSGTIADNLLQTQGPTMSYLCHGATWVGHYSLFDVGSGTYLVYQIKVPANEAATVTVDYKNWEGVGNGGVHQYTEAAKIRWYVTQESISKSFNGDVSEWEEISPNEEVSLTRYTYSYTLADDTSTERTLFACMKFNDNDSSVSGQAGWNDGAWVDAITFSTDATSPQVPSPPSTPTVDGPTINLLDNVTLTDALKRDKRATLAIKQTGRWADTYSLYDLGVGQYILYRIELPDGDGVQVTVDYKDWTGVGNGGVHRYSEKPKAVWYVTDQAPAANFNGNTSGWTRIPAEEELSAEVFTYTYRLFENGDDVSARTLYACMVFTSNDSAYHGQAGGNDGAWIDAITFDRLVNQEIAVSGISLNKSELSLNFGKSERLLATVQPTNATLRRVTWSSDQPDIVSVDRNGVVMAMGVGSATVTATTEDGGYRAQCRVTVSDQVTEIHLTPDAVFDTKITAQDSDDAINLPYSWYCSQGDGASSTQIVTWDNLTFRDLNNRAYAIYRLRVPADHNARIHLSMVTGYTDAGGTHSGAVSGGKPRMQVYFSTDELTLATLDRALWTRADHDAAWSADRGEYSFTVSSMSHEERYVYVKIVSTHVDGQGAWIQKLSFDTVAPMPLQMLLLSPGRTEYTVGEELDLRGLTVAVRYDDGSSAILSPDDYTVGHTGKLTKNDTEITVTTKDGLLSDSFRLTLLAADGNPVGSTLKKPGVVAGIIGGALALCGAAVAAILVLTQKKRRK